MSAWVGVALGVVQGVFLLLLAPLLHGIQRKLSAVLQQRVGPPVTQPYRDFLKLWSRRDLSVPETAGRLYWLVPAFNLAIVLAIAASLPVFINAGLPLGDIILIIYSLALSRFLLSAVAFEIASPLPAASAWRENAAALLIEVAMLFAAFIPAMLSGSTSVYAIVEQVSAGFGLRPSYVIALASFFVCMLIEAGILPFDIAEAEQEIQEGVLQEYSGRLLALLQLLMWLKRAVLITLFLDLFLPFGVALALDPLSLLIGIASYLLKALALTAIFTLIALSNARLRLVDLPGVLSPIYALSLVGIIAYTMGW